MSRPIIEVENLSKLYRIGEIGAGSIREEFSRFWERLRGRAAPHDEKEFWALRDVSFTVQPGEVVGIIGRNGAGKSTLLKILSRITEPTSGRAVLRGRVASLLEVGTGFHPDLTGRDNIYLNGAILGMKRAEIRAKFDEIVAFAEVERFIDTPVKRYSSGMYVRLAFAVAAHLEPEILIIDEVLAVGDAQFQKKCLGKMQEVSARDGRTVLFVSHNMSSVLNLCSRAFFLNRGALVCQGEVTKIVTQYLSSDLRENLFQPNVGERAGDGRARIESFGVNPSPPQTGMPVEFIFVIEKPVSERGQLAAELAVSILTEQDNPIFQLFSQHMGVHFQIEGGTTRFVVRIECLPLVPGRYRVNLWLGSGNTPIDWIRGGFLLSVAPGHLDGKRVVESRGYPVVIPAMWVQAPTSHDPGHLERT